MAFRVLTAMLIVAMFAGCGSESTNSEAPAPAAAVPTGPLKGEKDLQGIWRSSCSPGKLEGLVATVNIGITQLTELTVKEDTVTERTLITSGDCDRGDIEIISFGAYTSSDARRAGVKAIDLNLGQYRVRPLTEFGERVLNLAQFCGIADWRIGMVRAIRVDEPEARGCLPKPTLKTVYSIQNDRLYFGFDREVAANEDRRTDLRRDWYFKRDIE